MIKPNIDVNGVSHTWDANGNLLSDGTAAYSYNHSNQLVGVTKGGITYSYTYDGNGNRLRQTVGSTVTNYLLDTAGGLSQVLVDGTNAYLYGLERISQSDANSKEYYLGDTLGSVRQLVNTNGTVVMSRSYEPYGTAYNEMGNTTTAYGYTSEWTDGNGLVNLRARYYDPGTGRFVSKDTWAGDYQNPITLTKWLYANANPVMYVDPSGKWGLTNTFTLSNGGFYNFGILKVPSTLLPCSSTEHCLNSSTFKANVFIHGLGGNDIRYSQYEVVGADSNSDITSLSLSDLQLKYHGLREITDCQSRDYVEIAEYFSSSDWRFITSYTGDSYNFKKENDSLVGYTFAVGNPITVPDEMRITGNLRALGPLTYGEALSTTTGSVIQLVALLEDSRFATMSMRHRKFSISIEQNKVDDQIYRASITTEDDYGLMYQLGYMNDTWFEVVADAGIFLR